MVNAALGLVQERRAERALHALRGMTSPTARVVRAGKTLDVPSEEVVAGDLVLLEDGDRIVADIRLIEAHDFEVDEAPLTGESLPVVKDPRAALAADTPLADRRTMAFMGTRVSRGRARGIVANTGIYTELGAIAGMLARVEPEETPLEQDLERFGQRVVLGCIAISALVFAAGFFLSKSPPRELFLVAVALAVAAIPEGLPAVTTIVLALGTTRMARRNALVRRLPAVETLGCAQVICTDKTGTLTQNAMTARKLWVAGLRYDVDGDPRKLDGGVRPSTAGPGEASGAPLEKNIDLNVALDAAAHARGAHVTELEDRRVEIQGDPTDGALLIMSHRARHQVRAHAHPRRAALHLAAAHGVGARRRRSEHPLLRARRPRGAARARHDHPARRSRRAAHPTPTATPSPARRRSGPAARCASSAWPCAKGCRCRSARWRRRPSGSRA